MSVSDLASELLKIVPICHQQPSIQHLLVKYWQAAQGGANGRETKDPFDWFGKERAAKEVPKKALPRMIPSDKEALYSHHPE